MMPRFGRRTGNIELKSWTPVGNQSFNLRRPREYAPLINLGAMSNNERMRIELFPRIERALDELLVGVQSMNLTGKKNVKLKLKTL